MNCAQLLGFLAVLLLFVNVQVYSQNINYAKEVLNHLCSEELHGRGYVGKGDSLAAAFIADEFEKYGLKHWGSSYMQPFNISVNTLPGKVNLSVNGDAFVPGIDFIVEAGTPTVKGTYEAVYLTSGDLLDGDTWVHIVKNAGGKFIILQEDDLSDLAEEERKKVQQIIRALKYYDRIPLAGIIIPNQEKLTWGCSALEFPRPIITTTKKFERGELYRIEIDIENEFIKEYPTQNVIGYIEGNVQPDSLLVITAHYDHLGRMGSETYFPGANDNASGTAMLLDMARHYSTPENTPPYSMVFMAFGAEEVGLQGSQYFTEFPLFPLEQIHFLINLDLSGTGDEGITVVNATAFEEQFRLLQQINQQDQLLVQVKKRGEACNSDHCYFHKKGVPCFFIYTLGGIQAYHDVYDKAETLPLTEYEDYFRLLTKFVHRL